MIDNANKDELIEQYLRGEISGALLDEFKQKLSGDEEFRKEVALQKSIIRNIKAVGREEWALKLKSLHDEPGFPGAGEEQVLPSTGKLKPLQAFYKRKYFLAIAASILVIISAAVFLTINKPSDPDHIFISYYKPYPSLEQSTRSLPAGIASEKNEAFRAYNEGNYIESIRLFNSILEKGDEEVILFYLGNAYLSADNPAAAESAFKKYLTKYKEFDSESRWYLCLSYLKQHKVKEAKNLLEEIVKMNNEYSKRAEKILSEQ